jgi:hypothetical protein
VVKRILTFQRLGDGSFHTTGLRTRPGAKETDMSVGIPDMSGVESGGVLQKPLILVIFDRSLRLVRCVLLQNSERMNAIMMIVGGAWMASGLLFTFAMAAAARRRPVSAIEDQPAGEVSPVRTEGSTLVRAALALAD